MVLGGVWGCHTLTAYQVTLWLLQVLGLNAAAVAAFKVDYYLRLLKESIPYFPKTAIAKKENGRFIRTLHFPLNNYYIPACAHAMYVVQQCIPDDTSS